MVTQLYYTAPDQKYFDELKNAAISIWRQYDDTYGYATEKINKIKDIQNVSDNFMYIYAMFDWINQSKINTTVSKETLAEIQYRLL